MLKLKFKAFRKAYKRFFKENVKEFFDEYDVPFIVVTFLIGVLGIGLALDPKVKSFLCLYILASYMIPLIVSWLVYLLMIFLDYYEDSYQDIKKKSIKELNDLLKEFKEEL